MNDGFIGPLIAFVVSAFITLILLLLGLYYWIKIRLFLSQALKTTGVVVENISRGSMYSPKVRFTAVDGSVCEFTEMISSRPPKYKTGDTVPVYYHRHDFGKARAVGSLTDLYYPALITGGLGSVFFLMWCLLGGTFAAFYIVLGPMGN